MGYRYNPFTGNFDRVDDGSGNADVESVTGDDGVIVYPDANFNIDIVGDGNITTSGTPNTLTINLDGVTCGTGQTIGATSVNLVTFDLGASAGSYQIMANVSGHSTDGDAIGSWLSAVFKTDGASATLVDTVDNVQNTDAALAGCTITMIASGNNALLRATGVAGKTINWKGCINFGTGTSSGTPNTGILLQQQYTESTTQYETSTATIPQDNTIPQITEGEEYMSTSYTPLTSTSILKISFSTQGWINQSNGGIVALFTSNSSDAIASNYINVAVSNSPYNVDLYGFVTPGSTDPITISVRVGMIAVQGGRSLFLLKGASPATFGGAFKSTLTIEEYSN